MAAAHTDIITTKRVEVVVLVFSEIILHLKGRFKRRNTLIEAKDWSQEMENSDYPRNSFTYEEKTNLHNNLQATGNSPSKYARNCIIWDT